VNRTLPACSVAIGTRERGPLLRDTVASILEGTRVPDEIVIIDQGGSAAELIAELDHPTCEIRYVASTTKGVTRARNEAVAAARHDAIVIVDDDVLVRPDWLEEMLAALEQGGERTVVTGRVLAGEREAGAGPAVSVKADEERRLYAGRIGVDVLFSNNMALHRGATRDVGPWDERLGPGARYASADDNDYGFRLLEAGYRIQYAPAATVVHRAWRGGRALRRVNWQYGRGQGAFYAKHASLRDLHMLWRLGDLLREYVVRVVRRPLRRRSLGGHGDLIYTAGVLSAFAQWLLVERMLPRLRSRG
jgi:GT2 family glycosyltransferase